MTSIRTVLVPHFDLLGDYGPLEVTGKEPVGDSEVTISEGLCVGAYVVSVEVFVQLIVSGRV